jgi:hypothetical protein
MVEILLLVAPKRWRGIIFHHAIVAPIGLLQERGLIVWIFLKQSKPRSNPIVGDYLAALES